MGYIFSYQDAVTYEKLLQDPRNGFISELQTWLVRDMIVPAKGQDVLVIGCGTGMCFPPLLQMGLQVSGLDPSPYMLEFAANKFGKSVELHRGFGEDLPFEDNTFNYACMVSSLEYVNNPRKTIEEATRVAKDQLFISAMNRYGLKNIKSRVPGAADNRIYSHARFFNIWELLNIIRSASGPVPIAWKSLSRIPKDRGTVIRTIQHSKAFQWYPFGTFIGLIVTLIPRYRTRPLTIAYSAKP